MLAAFLTTILFSLSAISARRLSHFVNGTEANLVRLLFVAVLLGLWTHFATAGISGAAFPLLFASGCIGFGVGDLAMFQAYPRIGARRTIVLIHCLAAPFGAIAEWLWLGHAPTPAQAGFGILILVGVAVALLPRKADAQPIHGLSVGISFGILSALCQGGGAVISRKAYEVAQTAGHPLHGVSDAMNAAWQRVLGGIVISAFVFSCLKVAQKTSLPSKRNWAKGWPWMIGTSLAGPALGVTCYQWALISEKTSIVLPIVATTPLVVTPMAHFWEGDRITWRTLVGAALAVAGVIGLTLAK
ncbi:MAG TPA: DMT family transporter [Verrucomicrobiae bacterium]|jgi:drug/metabolite transporter (DMT)-like permease|nr:DMT family transporter [Verrucomicrobiae bacterium]